MKMQNKQYSKLHSILGEEIISGGLVLVYGEAGTGKSTIAIQLSVEFALKGYKVLYLTTEHPFAAERIADIAGDKMKYIAEKIYVMRVEDFKKQLRVIDKLEMFITPKLKLIVIDTITDNYREAISEGLDAVKVNMILNRQLATLLHISKTRKIAILITGQMRSAVDEKKDEIVASTVMKYWPDRIVKLEKIGRKRVAIIEKSRNEKEVGKKNFFRITERGILNEQ